MTADEDKVTASEDPKEKERRERIAFQLAALLFQAKDEHDLSLVFHHAIRHHRDAVENAFLWEILLRVKDWCAFVRNIRETILLRDHEARAYVQQKRDDGGSLVRYVREEILPLVRGREPLHLRMRESLTSSLFILHVAPALCLVALHVTCDTAEHVRHLLEETRRRLQPDMEGHHRTITASARKVLHAFIRSEVTDPPILDLFQEYALMKSDIELSAAVEDARRRIAPAEQAVGA